MHSLAGRLRKTDSRYIVTSASRNVQMSDHVSREGSNEAHPKAAAAKAGRAILSTPLAPEVGPRDSSRRRSEP